MAGLPHHHSKASPKGKVKESQRLRGRIVPSPALTPLIDRVLAVCCASPGLGGWSAPKFLNRLSISCCVTVIG